MLLRKTGLSDSIGTEVGGLVHMAVLVNVTMYAVVLTVIFGLEGQMLSI